MTGEPDVVRVVIADDHPVVRDGLSALLGSVPGLAVAATAATGSEAVSAAAALRPDVLVMDIQMPGTSGIEATREVTRAAPGVAVLMLTMFEDADSLLAAVRAGARGYVLKGAQQAEIVRAIRAVASGEVIFGPGVAARVLDHLTGPPQTDGPFPELTPREREVLTLIADGQGNATIGARLGLSRKTVGNHVSNIFAKLQVATRAEAVARARDAGVGGAARSRPPGNDSGRIR